MKNASFTIEFTTHMLANSLSYDTSTDHDVFQKDSQGRLIFQQNWWYSAFSQAIALAKTRGIKPADIHIDLTVDAPISIYARKYVDRRASAKNSMWSNKIYTPGRDEHRHEDKDRHRRYKAYGLPMDDDNLDTHDLIRKHEAIYPGVKIKFSAVVSDHVTQSQLTNILTTMGKFVGLSPYGYKLGYGKFNLLECLVDPSEAAQISK